jgi:hypothetical protein
MRARQLLVVAAGTTTFVTLVRAAHRAQLVCGATRAEQIGSLAGDGLVPVADLAATRAIDIAAPPDAVWPWLVQIGQGRGGFYSYDALENLIGLGIHSADRIVPQWQDLAVGDPVHLADEFALTAAIVEPGSALVLHGDGPVDDEGPSPFAFSWAFVLSERSGGSRLVVRERYSYRLGWAGRLVPPLSWVSFVMTQRMLRGIRDRAEGR